MYHLEWTWHRTVAHLQGQRMDRSAGARVETLKEDFRRGAQAPRELRGSVTVMI